LSLAILHKLSSALAVQMSATNESLNKVTINLTCNFILVGSAAINDGKDLS